MKSQPNYVLWAVIFLCTVKKLTDDGIQGFHTGLFGLG